LVSNFWLGWKNKCSTPYGIRGLGTWPHCWLYLSSTGAQRLTASEVWALATQTPNERSLQVLNALRHQRFGHMNLLQSFSLLLSAQRLTASEVWALERSHRTKGAPTVLNALRHQRFGHWQLNPRSRPSFLVLNALRHQRFGHTLGFQRATAPRPVLNALRHQRFGHLAVPFTPHFYYACSTPYGIRGLGTKSYARESAVSPAVLNALRHQRFGHPGG